MTSITNTFGANAGDSPIYIQSSVATGGSEEGEDNYILGSVGGSVKLLAMAAGDPRKLDPNILDEYFEQAPVPVVRTDSSASYTQTANDSVLTKIGRSVHMEVRATIEATATTAGNEKIYIPTLPYPSYKSGNIVGQCSPMSFIDVNGVTSILDVIGTVAIGHTFDVRIVLDWTTNT